VFKVLKWIVTPRQQFDLEMLCIKAFTPLNGFMGQADYESVLAHMRLEDGQLWPMPITLDVNDDFAEKVNIGDFIELTHENNTPLARMLITDKWQANKQLEAERIFGTLDPKHPSVHFLFHKAEPWYLGGTVELLQLPNHPDFTEIRHTPSSLKKLFIYLGWEKIIGFQTRNPLHRAHFELTLRAAQAVDANLLIHPVVGLTQPGDIDYFTRVRCYQKIMAHYPLNKALLSLLPLAMRMGGPKEALWHALIRKNYGCTHFIIGRDHAGPSIHSQSNSFYEPYAAQKLVGQYQDEIGITMVPFEELVYIKERNHFYPRNEIKPGETPLTISGTQLRQALQNEKPLPPWFSFPEILAELKHACLPRHKKGFTLFFTGLSGAGKSVLSQALLAKLKSLHIRHVTLLDSDITRRILATDLGFSKKDRDLNIQRLGFVASEITKAGGIAICAAIAPYAETREKNRELISQYGGYIEIYISTPFSECVKRDTKGLYTQALNGRLQYLTGLDDPYQPPSSPELTIDTTQLSIEKSINKIIDYLTQEEYLKLSSVSSKQLQNITTD